MVYVFGDIFEDPELTHETSNEQVQPSKLGFQTLQSKFVASAGEVQTIEDPFFDVILDRFVKCMALEHYRYILDVDIVEKG